ncbi:MAG: hypothetical protein HZB26_15725 [Candidatus Hydrogenedentes bacterium]|nr:hypothetical protein [Candidatus Hydrogenedentota bacterium]
MSRLVFSLRARDIVPLDKPSKVYTENRYRRNADTALKGNIMDKVYEAPLVAEYGHVNDILLQGTAEIGNQIVSFVEHTTSGTPTYSLSNITE